MTLDKPFLLGKGAVPCFLGDCISQGAGTLTNGTEENAVTYW